VGGRIADHLLHAGAGAALPLAAALSSLAGLLQPFHQVVSDRLQLLHVGDVPLRAQQRVGGLARLAGVCGVGGKMGLEAGDLPAQLAPAQALVALDSGKLVRLVVDLGPLARAAFEEAGA
jgi:hypothetical protein